MKKKTNEIRIFGSDFRRLDLARNPVCAIMRWLVNHGKLEMSWKYVISPDGCSVTIDGVSTWLLSELVESIKLAWSQGGYSWDTMTLYAGHIGCKAVLKVKTNPNDNGLRVVYKERN